MEYKDRQIWVDYIRVIGTFCVVILHSAAPLLYDYNELPNTHWWIGNIYDSVVRMSVPLFFMLSGHLLLNRSESLSIFFRKRFNKVVIPLLAWSIIYVFLNSYFGQEKPGLSFSSFYSIAISPSYYHLWFLYALIGVYLFVPILRVLVNKSDKILLYYYVLLWLIAVSIIPIIEKATDIESRIDLLAISGYVGYFVLGYLLGRVTITKRFATVLAMLFLLCVVITATGTYWLTLRNEGNYDGFFYNYLSLNVVILSSATFLLIKYFVINVRSLSHHRFVFIIQSFSNLSLGIYLIHPMFLDVLERGDLGITLSGFIGNPIYSIPLTAIVTFALSCLTIFVIRKIPFINRIAP